MSKIIASAAIRGAHQYVREAEELLVKAIEDKGESQKVEFPETAFYFPMANALMGAEVKTLGDIKPVLQHAKDLLPPLPRERLWVPYLGWTLDAGIATLLSQEIIEGIRYLYGEEPKEGWWGFISDTIQRQLGIQLVDGRMPGFVAIIGAAPNNEIAVKVIRELQKRNMLIFLCSQVNGKNIRDQLLEEGVQMGWETYIVPLGPDTTSTIYSLNWAIRAALIFGGLPPGSGKECLKYTLRYVHAYALVLGELDDQKYATGAGAINMGFPAIADTPGPEIRPTGICKYEHVVREPDYDKIVPVTIQVRGVKVKVAEAPVPVPVGAAFEGESVRKEQMQIQFGGKYTLAMEYLRAKELDEVEDGKIEVVGPEADEVEEGGALPLGIIVKVAGRKMHRDFEPILERQLHRFTNFGMGIWHMGQRSRIWVRISKDAYKAGFRIRHFGELLRYKLLDEFGVLVDKVEITLYTIEDEIRKILPEAEQVWNERDARLAGMTDEAVDTYYSCTLCQSYAPNHVCIISPERTGLCGAYTWLDGKAYYEIDPTGSNQPVKKGECLDPIKGQWRGCNEFTYIKSNRSIEKVNLYSLMEYPMTSCGCFECIAAVLPEVNGFMVVNREYTGDTPLGIKFSTLAGTVGGGHQTPGFVGVARVYLASKKFALPEGGLLRIVWMPKELKEDLKEKLQPRAEELGCPDLLDKIADETNAVTIDELMAYLEQVNHPALSMPPLF